MSTSNHDPEAPQTVETGDSEAITPSSDPNAPQDNTDAFPREYVEGLRKESATHRDRAKTAEARVDELSRALFQARVQATGKLTRADDLPYDADLVDADADALTAAIDALLAERPHYARREVNGSVGQGNRGDSVSAPTFADLLR